MAGRRSVGKMQMGRALWYAKPGVVELRTVPVPMPDPTEARVRMLFSGVSRGTERLVFHGEIGPSEWERMRAPLQEGAFPFPVKYGYCATGVVEAGPKPLQGREVFCLHPHQDVFVAPLSMIVPIPEGIPPRRATLAANMETALNAHWDAATGPGDHIVVVGAGVVGLLVAFVAAHMPGTRVTVIDVDEDRRAVAESLGARFTPPVSAPCEADIVFHTSASAEGLGVAIAAAGTEATIVELSWFGDRSVGVKLGGPFHSRRLKLIASQVGQVPPQRRPRWSHRRRLETALNLLRDQALDALVAEEISFEAAPRLLPKILAPGAPGLAPVIRYTPA